MKNTNTWICDSCGQAIEDVSHGWVDWLLRKDGDKYVGRDLRLVHHCSAHLGLEAKCQYRERTEYEHDGSILNDLPLKNCLNTDGLITLLSFIARDELPTAGVLEMIKRLHVPGYEQARLHVDDAISENVFEPNTMPGFYSTHDINAVLEYIRDA